MLEALRLILPEAIGLAAAIDAKTAPLAGERVEAAPDLFGGDGPLAELDAAADAGEVGHIVGDVRALRRPRAQQAGEADRIDDIVRARLPREQLIVLRADDDADRHARGEVAHGQYDQDRGIVAARRHEHRLRPRDLDVDQRLVARRIAFEHVAADRFGGVDAAAVAVDHDDARGIGAARDQFADRLRPADAEAQHDDMV